METEAKNRNVDKETIGMQFEEETETVESLISVDTAGTAEFSLEEKSSEEEGEKKKLRQPGQKAIFLFLLLVMVLLPIGRIVSDAVGIRGTMVVQSVYLMVVFPVAVLLILIESVRKRVPWRENALPYGCLILAFLFSFITSFESAVPSIAFFGFEQRGEGLVQIGCYYAIFILATLLVEKKYRANILYVILGMATIFTVFGSLQFLEICSFGASHAGMGSFPFGNPNFYSTFQVMFAGIAMGGFWLYEEGSTFFHPFPWWNRKVWLMLVAVSYIGCVSARSTSAYVGLLMMFLLLAVLNAVSGRRRWRSIGGMLLLLLAVMFILDLLSGGRVLGELISTITAIEKEGTIFGDSVGSGRMEIWKNVIALLPLYWLHGCGIDQLGFVYVVVYGFNSAGEMVDKAHNEYLNLWVTEGIIPLILYLILLFSLFIPGVLQYRKKNGYEVDDIRRVAILPFFGYIAQAFFNIRVISVAPFFWLLCGFLWMKRKKD